MRAVAKHLGDVVETLMHGDTAQRMLDAGTASR